MFRVNDVCLYEGATAIHRCVVVEIVERAVDPDLSVIRVRFDDGDEMEVEGIELEISK